MAHETWSAHVDYIMMVIGMNVGIGALWKFPYLCMKNGGGAFLIPFLLFTIIGSIPCLFLEMTIGQFSQSGPINVWNLCPPFKGIGVGVVVISFIIVTYMPVMFAWFLYYLYHSFSPNIPWTSCDNDWNTLTCISHTTTNLTTHNLSTTLLVGNVKQYGGDGISGDPNCSGVINATTNMSAVSARMTGMTGMTGMTAAEEFWRFHVLEITDGLGTLGGMRWPIVGCLAVIYLGVFLCMFKGIKVSGKIVYVTVAIPYILFTVILIRGSLLPGAADGVYYYIYPKFEKLLQPQIWVEACSYALYSLSIGQGCMISLAAHNKIGNNCYRDALVVTVIDATTAIYVGFAFFVVMGHVAHLRGVTVEAYESSGFNLGFIAYPEAVASLPLPQLWSALTFVMLLTLGIDTLLPSFEILVMALGDRFPRLAHRRWVLCSIVLLPTYLVSLVYLTQGGMYVLTLVEWYAFFPAIALFAMLECFVVCHLYGTNRMERDITMMWGKTVPRVAYIAMKFICPCLFLVVFAYSLYYYRPPKYGDYSYPTWATGLGWTISFSSIVYLPVCFIWTVYKTKGETFKEKIRKAIEPDAKWGQPAYQQSANTPGLETTM